MPTLHDVARLAGVSVATASRALAGKRVASENGERVRVAAAQLGYRPNGLARALVTRSSGAVAVLIAEPLTFLEQDPYVLRAFSALTQELRAHDMESVMMISGEYNDPDALPRFLTAGHVDGMVVVAHHGSGLPQAVRATSVPSVFVGTPLVSGLSYVDIDNEQGSRAATEHLVAAGCRRVGMVSGPQDTPAGSARLRGYVRATNHLGRAVDFEVDTFTFAGGLAATRRLLARSPDLDGLFVASDTMALGAVRALRDEGRRVPDDVKLVTFDNSPIAADRDWTSVTNSLEALARHAVEMVLSPRQDPQQRVLDVELRVRGSSVAASSRPGGSAN